MPPPPLAPPSHDPSAKYRLRSVTALDPVKYAKASDSLNKLYGANPKLQFHGRPTESFDRLFKRFLRELEYCGITEDQDASRLLPKMLNGPALTFYERHLEGKDLALHEACTLLKRQFHTVETEMRLREIWETATLESTLMTMTRKGQNPSLREAFNEFVKELQEVQEDLPSDISGDNELYIRILRAIRPYKEFQSVANNPPPSSTGLILAVNSAIEKAVAAISSIDDLMARARASSPNPSAHYVERYYNRAPGLPGPSGTGRQGQENSGPARQKQKGPCFVCWKRNCWSKNHPQSERQAAYKKRVGKRKALQYITNVNDDKL